MCDPNAMDSMDRAVARCLSLSGIVSQYIMSSDSPIILVFYEQNQLPQI